MRINSIFYDNYLKALKDVQDITEPRNTESKQIKELIYINNHIKRYYNGTEFSYATFEVMNGFRYKVTADARIYKVKGRTLKEIKPHILTSISTPYRAFRYMSKDKVQHNILLSLVLCVCAYESFLPLYLSSKSWVVNHTIIAEPGEERDLSVDNIQALEVCTHQQNIRHGYFVKRYRIYGVSVQSSDLDDLERELVPIDDNMSDTLKDKMIAFNKRTVREFYMRKGLSV